MRRLVQVIKYGWIHSGIITKEINGKWYSRISIFFDILRCFIRFRMWSNQYYDNRFFLLSSDEKKKKGKEYLVANRQRDNWQKDFRKNKRFLYKYSGLKYELLPYRDRRQKAYRLRYNAGSNLMVEHGVEISRQHYLYGAISIGNNVLLAKNVFLDYSGGLSIGDNVQITDGVHVLTHEHKHHRALALASDYTENDISSPLHIAEGAVLGTRSIILSSCNNIGKYARIGAGAVVTRDVPDYAVVVGVPAKIVKRVK